MINNPYVNTLESVWKNTKNVWINEEKLQELIEGMRKKKKELVIPDWTTPHIHPDPGCEIETWLNYICWINTVNFAFTNFRSPWNKFVIEHPKGNFFSGSAAMAASFMRALREGMPVTDAGYMSKVSLKDTKYIFRPADQKHQIPMLRERWRIFHEVGNILLEKYRGRWLNLFEQGRFRSFDNGKGIVELLVADFPSFRDARLYKDSQGTLRHLWFNKRAQLLVMMYHGRAVLSGFPLIEDICDIGPIADYGVPKALKFFEVLEYSPLMESAIQNHHIFPAGSQMEIENRLAMSYAMKKICDEVGVSMAQADFYIWEIGRKSSAPHILVPTTDY